MSNIGYVSKRRGPRLTFDLLRRDVEAVLSRRFGDRAPAARVLEFQDGSSSLAVGSHADRPGEFVHLFEVWVESPLKAAVYKRVSAFGWWLSTILFNDLAVDWGGLISDDGVGGRWPGEPGKYRHFLDYLRATHTHGGRTYQEGIDTDYSLAPPGLRDL